MANHQRGKIPGWLVFLGFMLGFWPGMILLIIRLSQESSAKDNGKARRTDREWEQKAREAGQRTYNAQGQRTYQPNSARASAASYARRPDETPTEYARRVAKELDGANDRPQGQVNPDGSYRYVYKKTESQPASARRAASAPPRQEAARPKLSLLDDRKLSPKIGKGLRLAGNIVLGCGAFVTAITFFAGMASGSGFFETAMICSIVALCCCAPGLVLSIVGGRKHDRVMRCRTYAAMIGQLRRVSIDELAAAIPTRYSKCVSDLQWMLSEGLLKGMYIDGTARVLTYPDAKGQPKEQPKAEPVKTAPNGDKIYPEEQRIAALNEQIVDEYVSRRMERLEELTHKILAYAEAHPEKENSLRQFRNHYLPKTFSILESYARMERMGVNGGNISSAMKDVEDIMDKLVLGFEKQLDALFDSEALDVTTDVSVLENMMTMEGLSDLDPFGSLKQDDELLRH